LAVEGDGGIPRAVSSIEHPAPAGIKAVKDPDGLSNGGSEVRRRRIHRDHQIEVGDQCCGFGKIIEIIGQVDHLWAIPAVGELAFKLSHGGLAFLQAVKVGGDRA